MNRIGFIQRIATLPLITQSIQAQGLKQILNSLTPTERMPVLFVGHGSPMNAIEINRFSTTMHDVGTRLPKPKAILMISAHWETKGTKVTAQAAPPTIHDFGGFPQSLFETRYPAPGSSWLADEARKEIKSTQVGTSDDWGFDHGA